MPLSISKKRRNSATFSIFWRNFVFAKIAPTLFREYFRENHLTLSVFVKIFKKIIKILALTDDLVLHIFLRKFRGGGNIFANFRGN